MNRRTKLCVVTTHPIQYMAPWFRALAAETEIALEVIFFRELNARQQGVGFGQAFQWDVPLRQGYSSKVIDVNPGWLLVPSLLFRLRKLLGEIQPDAVLITGWNEPGLMASYPLVWSTGVPILLRGESNALRHRSRMTRFLHRLLLGMVAGVTVIGKANRQFYLNNGMPPVRLFAGAYFVESERMLEMATAHVGDRDVLRRQAGYDVNDFVFCFVGKHVPFKRPMLLVEAAGLMRAKGWSVKLHFAGSGELTESLRARAEALQVPMHFTGFLNQTELWQAYVPSDAFVLPSTNGETWGLVTNEAMLFGLPVIVSDQVGCAADLVREGETGYVFTGEADGLAAAMELMVINRGQMRAMGERARQLVLDDYSMHVASNGLKAALQAVCS
jgi:glycosyltransferase involved in cell wall biosynthesis